MTNLLKTVLLFEIFVVSFLGDFTRAGHQTENIKTKNQRQSDQDVVVNKDYIKPIKDKSGGVRNIESYCQLRENNDQEKKSSDRFNCKTIKGKESTKGKNKIPIKNSESKVNLIENEYDEKMIKYDFKKRTLETQFRDQGKIKTPLNEMNSDKIDVKRYRNSSNKKDSKKNHNSDSKEFKRQANDNKLQKLSKHSDDKKKDNFDGKIKNSFFQLNSKKKKKSKNKKDSSMDIEKYSKSSIKDDNLKEKMLSSKKKRSTSLKKDKNRSIKGGNHDDLNGLPITDDRSYLNSLKMDVKKCSGKSKYTKDGNKHRKNKCNTSEMKLKDVLKVTNESQDQPYMEDEQFKNKFPSTVNDHDQPHEDSIHDTHNIDKANDTLITEDSNVAASFQLTEKNDYHNSLNKESTFFENIEHSEEERDMREPKSIKKENKGANIDDDFTAKEPLIDNFDSQHPILINVRRIIREKLESLFDI